TQERKKEVDLALKQVRPLAGYVGESRHARPESAWEEIGDEAVDEGREEPRMLVVQLQRDAPETCLRGSEADAPRIVAWDPSRYSCLQRLQKHVHERFEARKSAVAQAMTRVVKASLQHSGGVHRLALESAPNRGLNGGLPPGLLTGNEAEHVL
ncbi:hypothetical protein OC842_007279, partial [Tilletia horrida]